MRALVVVELQRLSAACLPTPWIPASAGIQEKDRLTRRPQTTRPLNPSFPWDSRPLSVRTVIHGDCPGLVLGRQHRCEPPPQRARAPCPRKSGHRSRSEHRRSPSASSIPPDPPTQMLWIPACAGMTAKGRPPGELVSPLQDIICSGRCIDLFSSSVKPSYHIDIIEL